MVKRDLNEFKGVGIVASPRSGMNADTRTSHSAAKARTLIFVSARGAALNACVGEGLGTYWVGAFHEEEEIKKVPDLPKQAQVVAMIPLDYPAEEKEPATDQKSLKEVVHYNR